MADDTGKNTEDGAAVGLEGRDVGVQKFALFHCCEHSDKSFNLVSCKAGRIFARLNNEQTHKLFILRGTMACKSQTKQAANHSLFLKIDFVFSSGPK